jgi:imidazole glycerol phosphate synthase glutamine amidotransferase subunit
MAEPPVSAAARPIAIVDYGAGNVASVAKAFEHLGVRAEITADPRDLLAAPMVVFPGQGHFGQAMERLRSTGLDTTLRQVLAMGTPFLGICLGLQLLFEGSDEAPGVAGLGLLRGRCVAFQPPRKIPQIGWNEVQVTRRGSPMDLLSSEHFYFVHGFHAIAQDPTVVVATADYDGPFTAAVRMGSLFAVQFHPEKSGEAGLQLLRACLQPAWRKVPSTVRVRMVRPETFTEPTAKVRMVRGELHIVPSSDPGDVEDGSAV